ncbi:exported protein of unknown function (plasmid) [Agreia sp. COWG]|nr:exported protein of unknown function [Agreia sp. COWG]
MKRRTRLWALAFALTVPLTLFAGSATAMADTTYKNGQGTYLTWYLGPAGQSLVGGQMSWNGTPPLVGVLVQQTLRSSDGALVGGSSSGNNITWSHNRATGTSRCHWEATTDIIPGTQTSIMCRSRT